jgi:hypothetical protein
MASEPCPCIRADAFLFLDQHEVAGHQRPRLDFLPVRSRSTRARSGRNAASAAWQIRPLWRIPLVGENAGEKAGARE